MLNVSTHITEMLILLFISITFLQSGLDKIFDWKGNLGWLKEHFEKTYLGGMVPLLVSIIMVAEIVTGVLSVAGLYAIISNSQTSIGLYACVLAAITLLMLLLGQRVAKDYPGAFTITGYFIVVIFGVFIFSS